MITASHNPPSDNGFKCYAATGGQVIPPDDDGHHRLRPGGRPTARSPRCPSSRGWPTARSSWLGTELDEGYIAAVVGESVSPARDLSIVYTPMHGVGETSVAAALGAAGFTQVNILASQRDARRRLPERARPRLQPRDPQDARRLDRRGQGDRRRPGAGQRPRRRPDRRRPSPSPATPRANGRRSTATRSASLLAAFVMKETEAQGRLRSDHYLITTLVSSQMARALAEREGIRIEDDLLVGFKWIAQRIDEAGPRGLPLRLRGVARLPEGDARPRQGRRGRRAALRRAGGHRQGPQADRPGIPRRPLHRRRPLRRAADQQGDGGARGRRADPEADGRVPRRSRPGRSAA